MILHAITIQPVPLFTKAKDGCRPYVDVYSGDHMVYTSRNPDYYAIKLFKTQDGKVTIQLFDVAVRGDITIVLFHARQNLGRIVGIKIATLYFYSGFVPAQDTSIIFDKNDLDDAPDIGCSFRVCLNFSIASNQDDKKLDKNKACSWETQTSNRPCPSTLFENPREMDEILDHFKVAAALPKQVQLFCISLTCITNSFVTININTNSWATEPKKPGMPGIV